MACEEEGKKRKQEKLTELLQKNPGRPPSLLAEQLLRPPDV